MSLSAIIRLAKEYLMLGISTSIVLLLLFLIGYFIFYKKFMNGKKRLKPCRVLLYGIFIIYVTVVLGVTFLIRQGDNHGGMSLHILSSYIDAWNSFSIAEWRNIILNILMFVPLGLMLPLLFRSCEKWYITYSTGFTSTLLIETFQLISKRGIFEIDDLINNTLGCIIGYGIVMLFILNINKKHKYKKNNGVRVGVLQIPLIVTIIVFTTIFISYSKLEFGNLKYTASYNIDMDTIEVSNDLILDSSEREAYIYEIVVGNKEEAIILANEILSKANTVVNEELNDVYDDTVLCTSANGNYSLWVDYLGFKTRFTDVTQLDSEGKSGLTLREVAELLKMYNIYIPEEAEFDDMGDGNYSILVDMVKVGVGYLTGGLSCTVNNNNNVISFNNNILSLEPYKEYEILSEVDAYNKIVNGEFKDYGSLNKNSKIKIIDVTFNYEIDSKGFYQPVYNFGVETDSYLSNITIPALKKFNMESDK